MEFLMNLCMSYEKSCFLNNCNAYVNLKDKCINDGAS